MNATKSKIREPKFSGEEVFRELTAAELDGVTGGNVLKTRHDTAKNAINNVR